MSPPIVTFPVTSKFPVMLVLSASIILPDTLDIVMSVVRVFIVLPWILKSPVSILVPSINVVSLPVWNVNPLVVITSKFAVLNCTCPVSWSTKNASPTLKSPLWSTLVKCTLAELASTTSFACITVELSLSTALPLPMYAKFCPTRYIFTPGPSPYAPCVPYTFALPIALSSPPKSDTSNKSIKLAVAPPLNSIFCAILTSSSNLTAAFTPLKCDKNFVSASPISAALATVNPASDEYLELLLILTSSMYPPTAVSPAKVAPILTGLLVP